MVEEQLLTRDITDKSVLAIFRKVPRHEFIPEELAGSAYEDCPLPIGSGQTISQPYMVALMSQLLRLTGKEKVLEIGTGSGYQTAVLAELAAEVYSVERIERLALGARRVLAKLGYENTRVFVSDGTLGLEEFKPYDRIMVTAAAPRIPESLKDQLKESGLLVIPVGEKHSQTLQVLEKKGEELIARDVCGCVFVPLVGKEGWKIEHE